MWGEILTIATALFGLVLADPTVFLEAFLAGEGCTGTYACHKMLQIPLSLRKEALLDVLVCCVFCLDLIGRHFC